MLENGDSVDIIYIKNSQRHLTTSHQRLLKKMKNLVFTGILACVEAFLSNKMQRVQEDGWFSPCIDDISGIPTS